MAVKHARERRRISAQQLSDITVDLGYPVSRNTLTNYENGRKQSLDVVELIVLAMALEVPPIMLLYGGHPDDPIEVTPGHEIPTVGALAWFSGDQRMAKGALAQQDSYEATLLGLIRRRADMEQLMWSANAARWVSLRRTMRSYSGQRRSRYKAFRRALTSEVRDRRVHSRAGDLRMRTQLPPQIRKIEVTDRRPVKRGALSVDGRCRYQP